MTEVMRLGHRIPNAVVLHPIDWEAVLLTKGTDDHYLAQVFPSSDGSLRVWGLRVVETLAGEFRQDPSATNRRSLVVGDFQNGAGLYIREDVSVMVGMINDQFTKNLRTILAEERAAFAIFEPKAFAVLETVASAA
jgi:HK97 family phage major capsid protein